MTLVVELNGTNVILILESVNPQYDERLFIEFVEEDKFIICSIQLLF